MDTYILDIQKMSTEDGPGIRTTVFFKGCNLKCSWCHNPESIAFYRQKYWIKDKCIGCYSCKQVCPNSAVEFSDNGLVFDEKLCVFCLLCSEECPTNAIEVKGQAVETEYLVNELLKDKAYYNSSGGGVTLSGGEAAMHWEYVLTLVKRLKEEGLNVALDTAGNYPYSILQKLLPYLDLILYDIKIMDNQKHKEYTGAENTLILQNAKKLGSIDYPKVWVRTPIIPRCTDNKDNIREIGKFIKENMPSVEKWELVSFNNLSKEKYRLLGREWKFRDAELMEKKTMEDLCKVANGYVKNAEWSGATKLEV